MKRTLDRWFDKTARNWIVTCLDENGDQVGDSVVVGTRGEAMGIKLDNPAFKSQADKDRENEERYGKKRKSMNSFIQRIQAAKGSMIHESGKISVDGTSIVVDTPHGKWTLAVFPGKGVAQAVAALDGLKVTCIYNEK